MDAGVGRIIDWLEKRGLAEDTLVLFTSDNGMNMGHHGICGKGNGTWPINMYDTSVKVPMIAWQPGTVAAGRVVDGLYNHYDIFPTILEWAGVPGPVSGRTAGAAAGPASGRAAGAASADASAAGPAFLPGRSLAKILRGEKSGDGEDRPIVIYDPAQAYSEFGPTRMIRTKEAKYVHRYPGGPHEYYDLVTDPDERVNQFENVEYHDAIAQMRAGLGEWFERYADPALDGSTKAVSGHGQLDLAILDQQGDVPFAQLWMKSWW
jgi:arylsulfatase A-like enzyme